MPPFGTISISAAPMPPLHDPKRGVLEASLIVIVRQVSPYKYCIEETLLGDKQAGELLFLPDFRIVERKDGWRKTEEPITPDTRILLLLMPDIEEPGGWGICSRGECYSWVRNPERVVELRKAAEDALALRREWEAARDIPDARQRVKALWQYLWNHEYLLHFQTKAELNKSDAVTTDYIASQLETLDMSQLWMLLSDFGGYGGIYSHNLLLAYMQKWREAYDREVKDNPIEKGADPHNLRPPLGAIRGKLSCGLEGLRRYKINADLPYIRDLAMWAINIQSISICIKALDAFREMPDKENVPVIEAILQGFSREAILQVCSSEEGMIMTAFPALELHLYPESIPLLVRHLNHEFWGRSMKEALRKIVGKNLGKEPEAWLNWYKTHKGKEANK